MHKKNAICKKISHIILLLFFLITALPKTVFSQTGFFVPGAGNIFFSGDSSTIFSSVINRGKLGIGKNATVNFTGKTWDNSSQSLITDESSSGIGEGGWIRFLSDSTRQQISGGYNAANHTGASFPKLKIQNRFGVELMAGSNANIRNEINFIKGLFYLNEQILVVGNEDPGVINGYDSSHFFVTANKPNSGMLVRRNLRNWHGPVTFPVGSHDNAYTPAAVRNLSAATTDYFVTVFDSVRSNGTDGTALLSESINKTWQIGKPGLRRAGNAEVTLQHFNKDEGSMFAANRQHAYVSVYKSAGWDLGYPQGTPADGNLTLGPTLTGSGVNSRSFHSVFFGGSYFTKFSGTGYTAIITDLWLNAYRLDTGTVRVYWKTKPEINVKTFIVQRRLANETTFKDVDTVASQAVNAYSTNLLNYAMNDINHYRGISFYRLMLIPQNGSVSTYSDTVAVGNIPGIYSIMLWPNPTPDVFFVSIHKTLPAKSIIIWNVLGQKLKEEPVNGRSIIQLGGLVQGTYFISIVLTNDVIIETKKLLVAGR